MLNQEQQKNIKDLLHKSQAYKQKCMTALGKGDLQKASLYTNLDARTLDELTILLKETSNND